MAQMRSMMSQMYGGPSNAPEMMFERNVIREIPHSRHIMVI